MIIKMKKVAVVCLKAMRDATLDELQDLGVMHVEIEEIKDSSDRTDLEHS